MSRFAEFRGKATSSEKAWVGQLGRGSRLHGQGLSPQGAGGELGAFVGSCFPNAISGILQLTLRLA